MLGNTLLVITVLFSLGLFSVTASPMPGGDRGVGHAFMLILCGGGVLLFSGLLAWNLAANHRLDWLTPNNWLLFFGWLAFALAILSSAAFKTEWHPGEFPEFLRWLALSRAHLWLSVLLLVPVFWLFNFQNSAGLVPNFVQIPMKIGLIISVLMGLGLVFGLFRASAQQSSARIDYENERTDKIHSEHLQFIAEQKPEDPILNILALTGRFHDNNVRDAAIAKVKSHPDWEAELIRLLNETEWQSEVYQFIDGNQVDHPELFVEPIKTSLRRTAAEIKKRIKGANDLQDWHFEHFSVERCLRAIDEQFSQVPGADFRAEVRDLRAALDTSKPERFEKVKFNLAPVLDTWLKKHP